MQTNLNQSGSALWQHYLKGGVRSVAYAGIVAAPLLASCASETRLSHDPTEATKQSITRVASTLRAGANNLDYLAGSNERVPQREIHLSSTFVLSARNLAEKECDMVANTDISSYVSSPGAVTHNTCDLYGMLNDLLEEIPRMGASGANAEEIASTVSSYAQRADYVAKFIGREQTIKKWESIPLPGRVGLSLLLLGGAVYFARKARDHFSTPPWKKS